MDIYFAVLNFTLSGAIGLIGLLTLSKVSEPREVLFASLPLLFALHQFTEGFVWLGVGGVIDARALELAEGIFIYYAQGVLPFLVPLSVWLIERGNGVNETLLGVLAGIGLEQAIYAMYWLAVVPSSVDIVNNTIHYYNPWTGNLLYGALYVLTTCGALMLSSSVSIQLFGVLNLLGLSVIYLLRPYGFTSLWCLYAAAVSGLLYFYFVERRIRFLQSLRAKRTELETVLEEELERLERRNPLRYGSADKQG